MAKVQHYYNKSVRDLFLDPEARFLMGGGGGGAVTSLTTTGTSGAATLAAGVLNIPQYAGAISSVTAANTSLTISPTTGAVTAGINLANSNNFTVVQSVEVDNLGAANGDAIVVKNTTAAQVNAQQVSPSIHLIGQGWKTTATAGSQQVEFLEYVLPVQSTTNPIAEWHLDSVINGLTQNKCIGFSTNGNALIFYKTATAATFCTISTDTNGFLLLTGGAASAVNVSMLSGSSMRCTSTRSVAGNFLQLTSSGATSTSGENALLDLHENFAPTSGTGTYEALSVSSTINQTGGANGVTRGIYINPTLTAATDYRAIDIVKGRVVFAPTTTAYAAFNLPAGTAPTSPVDGDVWREDNTNTGLKIRINGVTKTITVS